jgi:fructokinase
VTLHHIIEYIRAIQKKAPVKAIGLAVFAPLDLDPSSPTYGYITSTPKMAWRYYNIVDVLKKTFRLPIGFDTDVNGAALGEYHWGAAKNIPHFVYLTVGTGIGGGAIINNQLVHGAMHPEMGHLFVPKHPSDDFTSVCSYHSHCLEGFASGPAILKRWGVKDPADLPDNHLAWDLEAYYLGMGLANIIMTCSPQKIIIGGGVMHRACLLPKIHDAVLTGLNGYISCKKIMEDIENVIVPPALGDNAGVCGALALADRSLIEYCHY